jgi:hypothetical protein
LKRTGLPAELEQASNARDIDLEPAGDGPARALVVINGHNDPFSEIFGEGFHRSPPFQDPASNRVPTEREPL